MSATIHVRVAARQFSTPDAGPCLRTCLDFLNQNRETNPGVDNAKASLLVLMNRLGVVCQDDQVSVGTRPGSSHQSLSRYPSTDKSAQFPLMQSPPKQSHSKPPDSTIISNNSNNPITPDFDIDRILQNLADGQLSASPSSTPSSNCTLPAQYQQPAPSINHEFQLANAYDTSLIDPVGFGYSQAGVGSGEQNENYAGLVAYGDPVQQYIGSVGPFGR